MELSNHGLERIYDRTKLHPDDVLSIVSAEAAVDLGVADGQRYFLFYSQPNKSTKIALVSEDRRRLISIWEKDYNLPTGVKKVTWQRERDAQTLLQAFLFARIKAKNKQNGGAA